MFVIEIEGAAGDVSVGVFVIEIEGAVGGVSIRVFVIEIEGAAGLSPSGCLSLTLNVLWGMSLSGRQ